MMNKDFAPVTLRDVAKAAGVSVPTASRIISGSDYHVNDELRKRILEAAAELQYAPNYFGRALRKGGGKEIGAILPTITNPFYAQILAGIETYSSQKGYSTLFVSAERTTHNEQRAIQLLKEKSVDGMIISCFDKNTQIEQLMDYMPVVTVDQGGSEKMDRIVYNFTYGGYLAGRHLLENGHRDIAFLTSPLGRTSRQSLLDGLRNAMEEYGLTLDKGRIINSDYEEETNSGYEYENGRVLGLKFLQLDPRPTAIFAVNDMTAVSIIKVLREHGVQVAEDVSIIGFDNIDISAMCFPTLTTIDQPAYEAGVLSAKRLIDRIEGIECDDREITLNPTLIVRQSVKKLRTCIHNRNDRLGDDFSAMPR